MVTRGDFTTFFANKLTWLDLEYHRRDQNKLQKLVMLTHHLLLSHITEDKQKTMTMPKSSPLVILSPTAASIKKHFYPTVNLALAMELTPVTLQFLKQHIVI